MTLVHSNTIPFYISIHFIFPDVITGYNLTNELTSVTECKYDLFNLRCSTKKVFLEISQNSQENTCAKVSFLLKFAGLMRATLLKIRPWHRRFPANFVKFLRTSFLQNTSRRLLLCGFVCRNSKNYQVSQKNSNSKKPHLTTSWNHSLYVVGTY